MKYTLKPYQESASDEIMARLSRAQVLRTVGTQVIFSLCAPTGAGKTVIATDVFERMIIPGDDNVTDEKAAILWLSDSPDLNRQSRFRIEGSSSELMGRTVEIDSSFNQSELTPGRIYFLNTQKIGKGTKLAGRPDSSGQEQFDGFESIPDMQQFTIWDILRNTINADDINLYFVVDEAHRGAGKRKNDHATILRRLIEGHLPAGQTTPVPPMSVVMGVSATPGKFEEMARSLKTENIILPDVVVPTEEVQDSGLLKDIINLHIPSEEGKAFEGVFVREAAALLAESSRRWAEYHENQGGDEHLVVPLMVVQVADKATGEDIYKIIKQIHEGWPELSLDSFANVFGEHKAVQTGHIVIPYVQPQSVEDRTDIRVLFAKSAISTGWDCPRAEVLVSFRPAEDRDHITQIIGRMVRSPLARRIPGNDLLNSVLCLLPRFNKANAIEVVKRINRDGDNESPSIEVVIDPETLVPVSNDEIWSVFTSIPTEIAPKRSDKPVSRLINLGIELEADKIVSDGQVAAERELRGIIDGLLARHKHRVNEHMQDILQVDAQTISFDYLSRNEMSSTELHFEADDRVVTEAFDLSVPVFTRHLAGLWVSDYVTSRSPEDMDDNVTHAQLLLAALSRVEGVKESLWHEADMTASKWLDKAQPDIAILPDDRQPAYATIREMSEEPSSVSLRKPSNRSVTPGERNDEKIYVPYPRYDGHLLVGDDGKIPAKLNTWEEEVVTREMGRTGAVAWYRNPSHPSADALTATFYDANHKRWRNIQPDFIFFRRDSNGIVRPSIIDPHGDYLGDALNKVRGLARYAEQHGDKFIQILSISGETPGQLRALDLKDENVRKVISDAGSIDEVFNKVGREYA